MNEFIHSFSVVTHLYLSEKNALERAYREYFFYNSKERKFVLSKYATDGLRIQIEFNPKKEKQYDKKHRDCKVELIITPAKLLYPGEAMQKLFHTEDYIRAIDKLKILLQEIEFRTGVNLWNDVKLKRIDLAKDIMTPSNEYSKEVIRLAKKALYKTGYNLWTPTKEDVSHTNWEEENSILFRNHNQGVNSKIYNKLEDMKNQRIDTSEVDGLLRFELSLKRDYLKDHSTIVGKQIKLEDLAKVLCDVLEQANSLMQTYLIDPLWSGEMLSKDLQEKRIQCYCKQKNKRRKKMLAYRRKCNKNNADPLDRSERILEHFEAINLSPIYASDEFDHIPSFKNLLNQLKDEQMERFLKLHTRNTRTITRRQAKQTSQSKNPSKIKFGTYNFCENLGFS